NRIQPTSLQVYFTLYIALIGVYTYETLLIIHNIRYCCNMKLKILNLLLLLSSLFGYLEWVGNNQSFLAEAEYEILKKLFTDPKSIIHPYILLPLLDKFCF